MGKPSQLRRSHLRMTLYNLKRAKQESDYKLSEQELVISRIQHNADILNQEVMRLTTEISHFPAQLAALELQISKVNEMNIELQRKLVQSASDQPVVQPASDQPVVQPAYDQPVVQSASDQPTSDHNMDGTLTVNTFFKYMDELHKELMTTIGESVRTEVSLVDIT